MPSLPVRPIGVRGRGTTHRVSVVPPLGAYFLPVGLARTNLRSRVLHPLSIHPPFLDLIIF